ncbi:GntR family transcriptional regulator [Amycolatopsis sp. NPDC098790]|uniref:GntR family transcriptional regulator n=1 Tax=Amycolatopsis sp. NPDC098790 TaxID=3363939 RepID=UPI003818AC2B
MASTSLEPLHAQSLADQVYVRIRQAVGDGSLRPGQKITERDLASRLNVSPTPVREALRQLLRDRIVERTGSRSLRVAAFDAGVLHELAEVKARLNGMAARLAARKRTPELVSALTSDLDEADRLRAALESAPVAEQEDGLVALLTVLHRFHRRIEQAAGNPVVDALLDQSQVFTDSERHLRTSERIEAGREEFERRYAEHRPIVDAIGRGDEDAAEQLVIRHHLAALIHLST